MTTSIFLAKAFSLYFLIMGLAIIVRRKKFQEVFTEFLSNQTCLFLTAIITVILGILLVIAHPMFTADWRSVITALAWLTLIKGLVYLFVPEISTRFNRIE